jgi:hypothetical protein
MFIVGVLRIVGLIINGARKKVTPQIRQISAGVGCVIWAGITYGFTSSDVVSTWLAIYPLFAVGELVNIHRGAHGSHRGMNRMTFVGEEMSRQNARKISRGASHPPRDPPAGLILHRFERIFYLCISWRAYSPVAITGYGAFFVFRLHVISCHQLGVLLAARLTPQAFTHLADAFEFSLDTLRTSVIIPSVIPGDFMKYFLLAVSAFALTACQTQTPEEWKMQRSIRSLAERRCHDKQGTDLYSKCVENEVQAGNKFAESILRRYGARARR